MINFDFSPSKKKLKEFSYFAFPGFLLLALLTYWRFPQIPYFSYILGSLAVVTPLLSLISPILVKPIYLFMTVISTVLGAVIAPILMGILYYGLLLPFSLFFKLTGRDKLSIRNNNRDSQSYWRDYPESKPANYFKQF